jgi:FtsP/CotA-like multicopper oxidase with cupredoxin domain/plastocyanin
MKRTQTMLITTVILSLALTSVFAYDFDHSENEVKPQNVDVPFAVEAAPSVHHDIEMEAVKMPDGMYAYRLAEYSISGEDVIDRFSTKPSIPGPTLVFNEGDTVSIALTNLACKDNFVIGSNGPNENSYVGIHVHGVHYSIEDDASYQRMHMTGTTAESAASCGNSVMYEWNVAAGTAGTWPYHDHTFSKNEVGAEDIGLFGAIIVNPASGNVAGLVDEHTGKIKQVKVEKIEKEFILWMVSSEVLGRSVFYGMEIDNDVNNDGTETVDDIKQTPLWTNPPLYASDGAIVRYHVLGLGDETHAFHLHGHRWTEDPSKKSDIIDVKEITPLQRHTFIIEASANGNEHNGTEGWMYHCHVFDHMIAGMNGMMMVVDGDDTLPEIGAIFTLSDEAGLWMKTLDSGFTDVLDDALAASKLSSDDGTTILAPSLNANPNEGTGFPLDYLGVLSEGFADSEARSLAVVEVGQTILFGMKDSQTKHTITSLIYPTAAAAGGPVGGNGILTQAGLGYFDTQVGIRGSTFITGDDGFPVTLDEPGLYVFVCKIHPYMFSAVIADDPATTINLGNVHPANADATTSPGTEIPLLDLSDSLTVLTRTSAGFPTDIAMNPSDPNYDADLFGLATGLLQTFYVITDPSNWKDYTQGTWNVNLPPAPLTTNDNDTWVFLINTSTVLDIAELTNATNPDTGVLASNLLIAEKDVSVPISATAPGISGIGEVWVNTQFESTVGKNLDGTPGDKPGTITVVNTGDWSIDQKIALPEIGMNHPHNLWADAKNEVIYQTQWFDKRMVAFDRESGNVLKDMYVGESPSHVMTAPAGNNEGNIYLAMNGEEQVTVVDPNSLEVIQQISTGPRSHPHGHWISSDGSTMVTPDFIGLKASIIDLETNTVITPEHEGDSGNTLLIAPIATGMMGDVSKFYTADFLGNYLSVIDLNTNEIVNQIDTLSVGVGLPIQTPVSPDDRWMITANTLGSTITVVDTSVDEIVATLPCEPGCHGVQWGAKENGGYLAYVSSKFSNALIVVDPDQNGDGNESYDDIAVIGKIVLAKEHGTNIDDKVYDHVGMGGQGVLTVPNVYEGWIQQTVAACEDLPGTADFFDEICGAEMSGFLDDLSVTQLDPLS